MASQNQTANYSTANNSSANHSEYFTDDYSYIYENLGLIYQYFPFERPIFLIVWEILVITIFFLNILVVLVLLRKQMRSPLNTVLVAMAISDSLTGLVTLPTYIAVYSKEAPVIGDYSAEYFDDDYEWIIETPQVGTTVAYTKPMPAVLLSDQLCRMFMISKFFISPSFHTVSIWLTLLLGAQRFTYVRFPFRARTLFTIRNTTLICIAIFVFSPVLHIFHVIDDKAKDLSCQWSRELDHCGPGCIYIIVMFIFKHFIPTLLLSIFTIQFIRNLTQMAKETAMNLTEGDIQQTALRKREKDNRRISKIVTAILVMFLIPEVPYGIFNLFSIISWQTDVQLSLEANRIFQASYELLTLVSFGANFCIYTVLNEKFRKELADMCSCVTGLGEFTNRIYESTRKFSRTGSSSL